MPLSKTLTQHISWPHGNINGDDLAPLGSCMDNTWHHSVQLGDHLATIENWNTTWKLDWQSFSAWVSFGCQLCVNCISIGCHLGVTWVSFGWLLRAYLCPVGSIYGNFFHDQLNHFYHDHPYHHNDQHQCHRSWQSCGAFCTRTRSCKVF